jgi:transcriptional regulator with GAF, ATPase, and Fis domain
MYLAPPPLRERRGDTALLTAHFLHICAERSGRGEKVLHPETLAWFEKYSWPGNIRELENLIYREYLLADEMTIYIAPPTHSALERRCGPDRRRPNFDCSNFSQAKSRAIANFEQFYLAEALTKAGGNVTKAASLVGKDRRAFGKLLKKHNMDKNLYYL